MEGPRGKEHKHLLILRISEMPFVSVAGELVIMKLHLGTQTLTSILEHISKKTLIFKVLSTKEEEKSSHCASFLYLCRNMSCF